MTVHSVRDVHDLVPQLANCSDFWRSYAGSVAATGKPALYRTGVNHPLFNGVLRVGAAGASSALEGVRTALAGVPWFWWVGPDSPQATAAQLVEHGATKAASMPVLAARLENLAAPTLPHGLVVTEVGAAEVSDWVRAYLPASGVSLSEDDTKAVVAAEAGRPFDPGEYVGLVGRVGGTIVASAALLCRHGVAGLYIVSTHPDHRRRGIGTALTLAALQGARKRGLHLATLQTSGMARSIYEGLGFAQVTAYDLYTL